MDKKQFIRSNIAIIILAILILIFGSYAITGMLAAP
jgi:hypothetical protein